MNTTAIAIHGGAGTILKSKMTNERETAYRNALMESVTLGKRLLDDGISALEAVEQTVANLEDCHLFNAGKGSVFTAKGTHEMDASIMSGKDLMAGAVSLVEGVKNPISLARLVMEHSGHVYLSGEGAMEFARAQGCPMEDAGYFFDAFRHDQWKRIQGSDQVQLDHSEQKDQKFGTVGAVALDLEGNIAAATSTGGMTNKKFGRIGDSSIIGAGTYANNKTCAVSCTGSGEYFIRAVIAYDVSALMEYKGLNLKEACMEVVHKRLVHMHGDGGLIAIDTDGNIEMSFNTEGMYRASIDANNTLTLDIYKEV